MLSNWDNSVVTQLTIEHSPDKRSVHAVTHRAQQNLRDFTAIRPCFQQFTSNCCRTERLLCAFQQIIANGTKPMLSIAIAVKSLVFCCARCVSVFCEN